MDDPSIPTPRHVRAVDFAAARAPEVRASLLLPIPHDAAGTQNSYRFVPWHSIAGESPTRPFRRRARP